MTWIKIEVRKLSNCGDHVGVRWAGLAPKQQKVRGNKQVVSQADKSQPSHPHQRCLKEGNSVIFFSILKYYFISISSFSVGERLPCFEVRLSQRCNCHLLTAAPAVSSAPWNHTRRWLLTEGGAGMGAPVRTLPRGRRTRLFSQLCLWFTRI